MAVAMTEPVEDSIDPPADESTGDPDSETERPTPERPLSRLADILEQFKAGSARADDHRVNDRASDGTRLSWESVTEDMPAPAPGTSAGEERPVSFQFDLGSALQRLGAPGDDSPGSAPFQPSAPLEPLPQRTTSAQAPSAPVSQPPIADLPVRNRGATQAASSPTADVQAPEVPIPAVTTRDSETPISRRMPDELPTRRQAPAGSVFDSVAPAPTLPATPQMTPRPAPAAVAPAAAPQPTLPPAAASVAAPAMAPTIPPGALPTLPPSAPALSPVVTAPIETAPSTPDLNALRSAQLRAKKQQSKGKMLSRSLLAFVLIGVAAGGALLFGRDYLFSVDWDRSLTPIVDQIQLERGQEFDHAVGLIIEQPDAYAETVSELVLGAEWPSRLPAWRALGLVGGDATASSVAAALATNVSAVYEPGADVIYRLAGATDVAPLRIALEEAWVAQRGVDPAASGGDVEPAAADPTDAGLLGTSSVESIVRRAVDRAALEAQTGQPMAGVVAGSGLPLPIAYELQVGGELGTALLATADLSPTTFEFGMPFPETLVDALDDTPSRAVPPVLREGDIAADPPVALGVDDWGLVWGAKLPASSVDRMTEVLQRDVYRTFTRGTASCFVAVFETDTQPRGSLLLSALVGWSSNSPAQAQAVATQLTPTSVQLEACDPGIEAPVPDASSVDGVIARQIARLSS
jgi:hypothetical protein